MDKIAFISDIHGNLEALQAVLEDIKERGIKKIICLGDIIAKGTHMNECVELIRKNCDVVVKGNCDQYFIGEHDLSTKDKTEADRIVWTKSKLSEETVDYLETLPYCHEFYLSGRLIRMFHAHPQRIDGFVGNIDKLERLYELFLPGDNTISDLKADVVVYGHIHMPYMQKMYNRVIVNTGSVGNSIDIYRNEEKDGDVENTSVANYAILSGMYDSRDIKEKISYELVSVPYNKVLELEKNTDNIELDSYQEEIRSGKYRDMRKVYGRLERRGIDISKI